MQSNIKFYFRGIGRPKVFPLGEDFEGIDEGAIEASTVRTPQGGGHSGGHHSGMTLVNQNVGVLDFKYGVMGEKNKKWLDNGKELSRNFPQGQRVYSVDGISAQINAQGGGWGAKTGLYQVNPSKESGGKQPFQQNRIYNSDGLSPAINSQLSDMYKVEIAQALQTDGQLRQGTSWGTDKPQSARNIRRLTPIECERLQGFPDGWTKYGLTKDGKVIEISDTQRYKMCGNAVTTNVITAIGKQFLENFDGLNTD